MSNAWNYFRSTPVGELMTGSALQAHPSDITTPLGVRFAGRTIVALHVALEKAATVRIAFDRHGVPRLSGIRHIRQRASAELGEVLRAEKAATRAEWLVIVFASGWQAVLGQRSARPEPTEKASAFSRHKLLFETPEVLVPRAQVDRVYTAVDHPVLDKSVIFSVRRRDLDDLTTEVRKCGFGIAAVRIAVAAQLESWIAAEGEGGLSRDLLLTDGLSALLLNIEQGDFVLPRSALEAEQPRQSVQRPGAIEEDVARFITANDNRSVTFVGPDELCAAVKRHVPGAEIVRPPNHAAHDTECIAMNRSVQHDLNFEAREVRQPLPSHWRRIAMGYAVMAIALLAIALVNITYAVRSGYDSYQIEKASAERASEVEADGNELAKLAQDFADAGILRSWVASNYHAQRFCFQLLRDIPAGAAMDKLQAEMKDGQIVLTFVVLGSQEMQLAAHRAIERAINDLRYKIGSEDLPVTAVGGPHGVQYRMHLIVPDAGETPS